MSMWLYELIEELEEFDIIGDLKQKILGISYDSRKVRPKDLFVAIKGTYLDGHDYIADAIQRGAVAILTERYMENLKKDICQIVVRDSRDALGKVSSCFYGMPQKDMTFIGITGTNGKTTTAYLIESILKRAGKRVGVVGTIEYRYGNRHLKAPVTTPESLDLIKMLSEMKRDGVTHIVMEVSSHALSQKRVDTIPFSVGIFTNLSHDHLDYHQSMERYFQAKRRLFDILLPKSGGVAIVNVDDPKGRRLSRSLYTKRLCYGINTKEDIWANDLISDIEGIRGKISYNGKDTTFRSPLLGRFNVYNILAAWAASLSLGIDQTEISGGIEALSEVPGRMQKIVAPDGTTVIIDYAHSPDALKNVILSIREFSKGRLITVFGCGGERDRKKRPEMGLIAASMSDILIITSDNPRSEDPLRIIEEIKVGVERSGMDKFEDDKSGGYLVIPERKYAIKRAIALSKSRDIILIAGKGHEEYQIIKGEKIPFSDIEEAKVALRERAIQDRTY